LVRTGIHGISALLEQKTETRPQPQLTYGGKPMDERGTLKPPALF